MKNVLLGVMVAALAAGCSGSPSTDAGTGGGGGNATGGGTAATGGGGAATGGGGGGGGAITDGGNGGTLIGELSFNASMVGAGGESFLPDAGAARLTLLWLDPALSGNLCTATSSGPLKSIRLAVYSADAGPLGLGTFPVGSGPAAYVAVARQDVDDAGQPFNLGELGTGSVTITRLDSRTTGSFIGTMTHADGGTSTLSGSWDAPVCAL